ncbi:MAG: hypothetical protein H6574_02485 [Lewinellaceae bacterium]|nr:hypothetical protein [Saprospiraceae bacterium]MCB9329926.1 hypothetical protein [Lewinellaceae bacterium]
MLTRTLYGALLFLFICRPGTISSQSADISPWAFRGYVKNLQQWQFNSVPNSLVSGGFFHNRLMLKYTPDSLWTFDVELRNRLFYGEWVRVQPGFAEGLDNDNGLIDLAFVPVDKPALVASVLADRLWAQWARGRWQVRAGRQRINWGKTLTWNPNDWFNAWNFLDFDYEERPGSDALRVQYQTGGFSEFDLAISPARHIRNAVAALRYGGHFGRIDWQGLAGVYRNRLAAGLGWAADVGQAGLKGEISVFQPIDSTAGVTSVSATAEVNMLFGGSWFCSGGLLINSNGIGGRANLFQLAQINLTADNLMPGKLSFLASVSHPFTPLLQGALSAVYSPNGQLIILIPTVAWSVANNWDIDLTGQLFWLENNAGNVANLGNGIFLRVRWSF